MSHPPRLSTAAAPPARGFTLIELMIAVIVMAVLVALAFPSMQGALRKSRRSEAFHSLTQIQQAQERHRSNRSSYAASLTDATTATPPGLGLSGSSGGGYYTLSLDGTPTATGYTAVATGAAGRSQAEDGNCTVLAVKSEGGNLFYGSGSSSSTLDWTDPGRCWVR